MKLLLLSQGKKTENKERPELNQLTPAGKDQIAAISCKIVDALGGDEFDTIIDFSPTHAPTGTALLFYLGQEQLLPYVSIGVLYTQDFTEDEDRLLEKVFSEFSSTPIADHGPEKMEVYKKYGKIAKEQLIEVIQDLRNQEFPAKTVLITGNQDDLNMIATILAAQDAREIMDISLNYAEGLYLVSTNDAETEYCLQEVLTRSK